MVKLHCLWFQNGEFGCFWPFSVNLLMFHGHVFEAIIMVSSWKKKIKIMRKIVWPISAPLLLKNCQGKNKLFGHFFEQLLKKCPKIDQKVEADVTLSRYVYVSNFIR